MPQNREKEQQEDFQTQIGSAHPGTRGLSKADPYHSRLKMAPLPLRGEVSMSLHLKWVCSVPALT